MTDPKKDSRLDAGTVHPEAAPVALALLTRSVGRYCRSTLPYHRSDCLAKLLLDNPSGANLLYSLSGRVRAHMYDEGCIERGPGVYEIEKYH